MKFAEFFAGVGLVREGLSTNGWDCVWANDISKDKKATYVDNFGKEDFQLADIWDVVSDPSSFPNEPFLYTASFPCTDLSVAGGRAGLAGKESGTLNAVLKLVLAKRASGTAPKVIMLENVKGFLTSHKGKDIIDTITTLSELDYYVDVIELDAALFTPQSRQRVFLIAVDKDLAPEVMKIKRKHDVIDSWWGDYDQYPELRSKKLKDIISVTPNLNWGLLNIPMPPKRKETLADIIEVDIPDDASLWWKQDRKLHLHNQMSERHRLLLDEMISRDHYSYGTVFRRMRNGKSTAEMRTDGIAGCLRTPRGGSSKQIVIRAGFGSWAVRLLTPREYARLQGVRDTFLLPDNDNKGYFAMGDAVCVPVIQHLAQYGLLPIVKAAEQVNDLDKYWR